jgi:type II secretory pathway pseudopilin PulG
MRKKMGSTLIEALLAVFIFAMSAVILTSAMPMATKTRIKADNMNKAAGMAQKMIEAVRGSGYANVTANQLYGLGLIDSTTPISTNRYATTNVDTASLDNVGRILPGGYSHMIVEQVDIDLRRVTVHIHWVDRGVAKRYVLGTLIANL